MKHALLPSCSFIIVPSNADSNAIITLGDAVAYVTHDRSNLDFAPFSNFRSSDTTRLGHSQLSDGDQGPRISSGAARFQSNVSRFRLRAVNSSKKPSQLFAWKPYAGADPPVLATSSRR